VDKFEVGARLTNNKMFAAWLVMHGVTCSVYECQDVATMYDEDDQNFRYNPTPDFEGKLLIMGLSLLRFGVRDEWTPSEILLYTPTVDTYGYIPKENAKIVVDNDDVELNLRVQYDKELSGQHFNLMNVFELIPWN